MKWLIAPGPFKESLSATEVADAIRRGLSRVFPDDQYVEFPICDGGSGFLDRILSSQGGTRHSVVTTNAIGQQIDASFGLIRSGPRTLAIIESAEACGLTGVPPGKRDPTITTTFGIGPLLEAAAALTPDEILIGCGDSATNDGGVGVAAALGAKFIGSDGQMLPNPPRPEALRHLSHIDCSDCPTWTKAIPITIACNLTSLLLGPEGTLLGPIIIGPDGSVMSPEAAEHGKEAAIAEGSTETERA